MVKQEENAIAAEIQKKTRVWRKLWRHLVIGSISKQTYIVVDMLLRLSQTQHLNEQ